MAPRNSKKSEIYSFFCLYHRFYLIRPPVIVLGEGSAPEINAAMPVRFQGAPSKAYILLPVDIVALLSGLVGI